MTDQFDRAELGPAGGDLGAPGARGNREQAGKPGWHVVADGGRCFLNQGQTFRIADLDACVLAAVEQRGHLQFEGHRVFFHLRHGERQ